MFWEQIVTHYRAGSAHQFLLHFNVQDLHYADAYGYLPAMPYLMEQLNLLGCDLVVGYNSVQGIIFPNVRQWRKTQKMLEIVPPDAADEVPLPDERRRINSNLAIGKLHEDPVVTMEPHPSEELQNRLSHLLRQGRAKVGLIINFLEQLAPNHPSLTSGAKR